MSLILHRCKYSASPWRFAWRTADGCVEEIRQAGIWWGRKRDGLPVLRQLQALGLAWGRESRGRWTAKDWASVEAVLGPLVQAEQVKIATIHAAQVGERGEV